MQADDPASSSRSRFVEDANGRSAFREGIDLIEKLEWNDEINKYIHDLRRMSRSLGRNNSGGDYKKYTPCLVI